MNESMLTQLKIIVERAVRPVRASRWRKRKMREELLAHVSAVFAEEMATSSDEAAALTRTAQRFGNPAELTTQLQSSVPALDRIQRFWEGPVEESPLRFATRLAFTAMALATLAFVVLLWDNGAFLSFRRRWVAESVAKLILAIPIYIFALVVFTHWMGRVLDGPRGRSWIKIGLITVVWSLVNLIAIACLPLVSRFGARIWFDRDMAPFEVASVLIGSLLPYLLALSSARRLREYEEWASLDLA
jgi:hypothetical protein